MRLVSTSMLRSDMVLGKDIYHGDCLILKKGQRNITRFVNSLHNMGIDFVYVEDEKSTGIYIPDAISEKTRLNCKRVLRQTIDDFAKCSTLDVQDISGAVTDILGEIMDNKAVQVSLNDISATDDYTFSHSVSTTVYSLLLARELNYSVTMMEHLAVGTLLHDIGKVFLNKEILFKEKELTQEEFEYVKGHTILGYQSLRKYASMPEVARLISLQHHERVDGTGYPRGLSEEEMHEFAKVVSIADVYDALTTDRCYRKKWSNEKAVNYLIECSGTKFDTKLVGIFIQQIAIYPNGSMVRLSDDTYAIIKDQNRSMPLRPIVRVIADKYGNDIATYELDLLKELSVTIVESEIELRGKKPQFEIDK